MQGEGVIVKGLTKTFGKVVAVNNISFELERGRVLTLLGPSGCGKSTTLLCIAGIERPDSGFISLEGKVVTDTSRKLFLPPEEREIGMVFQSYALWPHMTVFDNVAFPLVLRKYPKDEIRRRVREALALVGLEGLENRYPYQLSGGQQQRVALARAIVYEPRVLLLDEPLSNLDAKIRDHARFWLREFQRKLNITVIYVTHDQAEAMVLSDKIAVMNEGKILQIGTPKEIYENPASPFVADFIGGANLLPAVVEGTDKGYYLCRTEEGYQITARSPHSFKTGDRCLISFRPIHAEIYGNDEKAPEENILLCEIMYKAYLGGVYDYRLLVLEAKETRTVRVTTEKNVGDKGDKVKVYVPPRHVVAIPLGS